jgi:hypothetical protein
MRIPFHKYLLFTALVSGAFFTGCRKWDDHNAVTDQALTQNLFEQISANPSLSKFSELLVKTGYDAVLASSKTFTVFAPSNAALASLDAALVADSAKLSAFVGNHIATQSYHTPGFTSGQRIQMLNGKYHNLLNKTIEEAAIVEADKQGKNGVVQVIDKMLPVLGNGWQTLESDPSIPAQQKAYLLSLFGKMQDLTNAVQIGVNPNTGQPIYQAGTDSITTNRFWRNVYDLRDESKEFTLFVLADEAWTSEVDKFKPYYVTSSADSTTDLARWAVVKDLAVAGRYAAPAATDTVLSKFNVKVPVEGAAIAQTIKTSNGLIHILRKADVQPRHKILPFVIQGENYRAASHSKRGNTYFRDRFNPLTGQDFRDVNVFGHGTALFNLNYRINGVYSTRYKAYWVALNDFQTGNFNQKLGIGTPTSTTFNYTTVTPNNYNEVEIGEFEVSNYQSFLDIYLTAANSTTASANPIVCDYIKLVPVF